MGMLLLLKHIFEPPCCSLDTKEVQFSLDKILLPFPKVADGKRTDGKLSE